jgi:hypothetical protein
MKSRQKNLNKCEDLACFLAEFAPIPVKEQEMSGLAIPSANRGRLCGNQPFDLYVALQDLR